MARVVAPPGRVYAVDIQPEMLEFLRAIDYDLPQWAEDYMARMEDNLGEAYSEPAADVRGYVASVKEAATA